MAGKPSKGVSVTKVDKADTAALTRKGPRTATRAPSQPAAPRTPKMK